MCSTKGLEGGRWLQDRLDFKNFEGGKAYQRMMGGDDDLAKKGWGGGDWMDRVGMTDSTLINRNWFSGNKGELALKDFKSGLKAPGIAIAEAYGKGNWMKRAGFDTGWDASDFHKNWGGGAWQDRLGLGSGERASVDDMQSMIHNLGLSQKAWATNLGGGNWYKKKLGMGQFDKKGGGGADTGDEPTSTTETETETETTTETQMNQLTNEDPQEAARLAATRARRRRALKNKFGKRQTIRTSGRGASGY
tara:strand:+ start:1858 stop:2604 length:747 start_codon:yes stop_codon:yes gene_type:complete